MYTSNKMIQNKEQVDNIFKEVDPVSKKLIVHKNINHPGSIISILYALETIQILFGLEEDQNEMEIHNALRVFTSMNKLRNDWLNSDLKLKRKLEILVNHFCSFLAYEIKTFHHSAKSPTTKLLRYLLSWRIDTLFQSGCHELTNKNWSNLKKQLNKIHNKYPEFMIDALLYCKTLRSTGLNPAIHVPLLKFVSAKFLNNSENELKPKDRLKIYFVIKFLWDLSVPPQYVKLHHIPVNFVRWANHNTPLDIQEGIRLKDLIMQLDKTTILLILQSFTKEEGVISDGNKDALCHQKSHHKKKTKMTNAFPLTSFNNDISEKGLSEHILSGSISSPRKRKFKKVKKIKKKSMLLNGSLKYSKVKSSKVSKGEESSISPTEIKLGHKDVPCKTKLHRENQTKKTTIDAAPSSLISAMMEEEISKLKVLHSMPSHTEGKCKRVKSTLTSSQKSKSLSKEEKLCTLSSQIETKASPKKSHQIKEASTSSPSGSSGECPKEKESLILPSPPKPSISCKKNKTEPQSSTSHKIKRLKIDNDLVSLPSLTQTIDDNEYFEEAKTSPCPPQPSVCAEINTILSEPLSELAVNEQIPSKQRYPLECNESVEMEENLKTPIPTKNVAKESETVVKVVSDFVANQNDDSDSDVEIAKVVESHGCSEIDEASSSDGDIIPCDENTKMFTDEETVAYHSYLKDEILIVKLKQCGSAEMRDKVNESLTDGVMSGTGSHMQNKAILCENIDSEVIDSINDITKNDKEYLYYKIKESPSEVRKHSPESEQVCKNIATFVISHDDDDYIELIQTVQETTSPNGTSSLNTPLPKENLGSSTIESGNLSPDTSKNCCQEVSNASLSREMSISPVINEENTHKEQESQTPLKNDSHLFESIYQEPHSSNSILTSPQSKCSKTISSEKCSPLEKFRHEDTSPPSNIASPKVISSAMYSSPIEDISQRFIQTESMQKIRSTSNLKTRENASNEICMAQQVPSSKDMMLDIQCEKESCSQISYPVESDILKISLDQVFSPVDQSSPSRILKNKKGINSPKVHVKYIETNLNITSLTPSPTSSNNENSPSQILRKKKMLNSPKVHVKMSETKLNQSSTETSVTSSIYGSSPRILRNKNVQNSPKVYVDMSETRLNKSSSASSATSSISKSSPLQILRSKKVLNSPEIYVDMSETRLNRSSSGTSTKSSDNESSPLRILRNKKVLNSPKIDVDMSETRNNHSSSATSAKSSNNESSPSRILRNKKVVNLPKVDGEMSETRLNRSSSVPSSSSSDDDSPSQSVRNAQVMNSSNVGTEMIETRLNRTSSSVILSDSESSIPRSLLSDEDEIKGIDKSFSPISRYSRANRWFKVSSTEKDSTSRNLKDTEEVIELVSPELSKHKYSMSPVRNHTPHVCRKSKRHVKQDIGTIAEILTPPKRSRSIDTTPVRRSQRICDRLQRVRTLNKKYSSDVYF